MAPATVDPMANDVTSAPGDDPARAGPGGAKADPRVELHALLGRGTRYAGKLFFDGRTRIEGQFVGDIRGETLIIGDGADLEGDIEVDACIVTGGVVRADIRAFQTIELHAPAVVRGDLHAPNVFIDRGVQFEGNCKMAALEGPADRRGARRAEGDIAVATRPLEVEDGANDGLPPWAPGPGLDVEPEEGV